MTRVLCKRWAIALILLIGSLSGAQAQQAPNGQVTATTAAPPPPPDPVAAARSKLPPQALLDDDHAIGLGRAGSTHEAAQILARLSHDYPDDISIRRDYCAILNWDSHFSQSVAVYNTLPPDQPDWVVSAAAGSYRRLRDYRQALDLYRAGEQRFPDSMDLKGGELLTLTDAGQAKDAQAEADRVLTIKKDEQAVPILLAAAYAATTQKNWQDALGYYDRVLRTPNNADNHEAVEGQTTAQEMLRKEHEKKEKKPTRSRKKSRK